MEDFNTTFVKVQEEVQILGKATYSYFNTTFVKVQGALAHANGMANTDFNTTFVKVQEKWRKYGN